MTDRPKTLRELRDSGYRSVPVKTEMRRNLLKKLRRNEPVFPGIVGYEDTVFPQVQNAILSQHDLLFLGLRGQGKTRMLRMLVNLLDEALPIVAGSEVHDDPFEPLSKYARSGGRQRRRHASRMGWPGRAVSRKTRHPRCDHRRLDRGSRSHQARRGPAPGERGCAALRPDPAVQPRHFLHERTPGSQPENPGRPVQRARRAGRAGSRLSHPVESRSVHGVQRKPGRLHEPRPAGDAAQRPHRVGDPHALPVDPRTRDDDHRGKRLDQPPGGGERRTRAGNRRAGLYEGDRRRDFPPGPHEPARQPGLRRERADVDRQLRKHALQRGAAGGAFGRGIGRRPHQRSGVSRGEPAGRWNST